MKENTCQIKLSCKVMWLHCFYQWRKCDVTTVSDGNFHQKFYLQGQCYTLKNRRKIFHIKIISAKGEDSYSKPNIFLLFDRTSLFFFWRMNCVTPLFAWRGCAQPWTSSDLFCSIFTRHSCCTWSFHKVLPLINVCILHMLWPETEGSCAMDVILLSSLWWKELFIF